MSDQERILDKRIEGKFKMVKVLPGEIRFQGKIFDTRKMDVKTAKQLVKDGCKFIEEVEKATKTSTTKTPSKEKK